MISKPYAAFGYVVYIVTLDDKEHWDVKISDPSGLYNNGYYYYFKGKSSFNVLETGQQLPDRPKGWLNTEHHEAHSDTPGTVRMLAEGETAWLCLSTINNPKKDLPSSLTSFTLLTNETKELSKGSNIYLTDGTLFIDDKEFVGPTQIRVRSSDVKIKSKTDCYCLIFP